MRQVEIDWSIVKKLTLWSYEDLIKKILKVLSYNFIQEHYDHNMKEAATHLEKLLGYDPKYEGYVTRMTNLFRKLDALKVANYYDLVNRVENAEKCKRFVKKSKLRFEDVISVLNYIFRWVLPFRNVYLRQLSDAGDKTHMKYVKKLAEHNIKFNLDILEYGRTKSAREKLSKATGVPGSFITDLANRADLTRLPYMSKKTVDHLCSAGYDTMSKLATVDVGTLKEDIKTHFDKAGIRLGSFIDLSGLVAWAKATPEIIEN